MNNPKYDDYLNQENKYDMYTVEGTLDYGGYFGRMHPKMLPIILEELNNSGRVVLSRILQLLTTKSTEECKNLIGFSGYKYIVQGSQATLSKILGLKQQYISNGLDNLVEHGIVIRKSGGIIMINPLVYCKDSIYDVRCLMEFGLELQRDESGKIKRITKSKNKTNDRDNGNITRKKQDMSKVRTDLAM